MWLFMSFLVLLERKSWLLEFNFSLAFLCVLLFLHPGGHDCVVLCSVIVTFPGHTYMVTTLP